MIQEDAEGLEARGGADQFQCVRRSRERWPERHHELREGCTTQSPCLKGRTDKWT